MPVDALLLVLSLSWQAPGAAPPPVVAAPATSEAYFQFLQGHRLEGQGDDEGAIAAYRRALESDPKAAGVLAQIAGVYARAGRAPESMTAALDALKIEPSNRDAHRILGLVQAAVAANATDATRQAALVRDATTNLEQALAGGVPDPVVQLSLGRIYVDTGQFDKAIPTLRAFLLEEPNYKDGALALAVAYEAEHRLDEAIPVIEDLVADQPPDIAAQSRLAELYEEAGRWADAASAWGELTRRDPRQLTFRSRRATALVNGGDLTAGREELLALAKDAPHEVSVWYLLSQVDVRAGDAAAALDAAGHIAGIDPADPRGPLAMAAAKVAGKDYAGAEAILTPLVASPTEADVANGVYGRLVGELATAFQESGDANRAVTTLEDAHKRAPSDEDLTLTLASAYEHATRFDRAEATFREAIAKDSANAEALNDLGYMLANQSQKLDEAVGFITKALALDTGNPSFLDSLGWAYLKQNKPEKAREPLEKAALALPKTSVILDHLGEMYFDLKRYRDASGAWDRALTGDRQGIDVPAVTKKRDHARELAGR